MCGRALFLGGLFARRKCETFEQVGRPPGQKRIAFRLGENARLAGVHSAAGRG